MGPETQQVRKALLNHHIKPSARARTSSASPLRGKGPCVLTIARTQCTFADSDDAMP